MSLDLAVTLAVWFPKCCVVLVLLVDKESVA